MMRRTATAMFLILLIVATCEAGAAKKKTKKPKVHEQPRLEATDESQVDRDYAFQGEYVGQGKLANGTPGNVGAQVVPRGDGKFFVVVYPGGLPGAGWKRGDEKFTLQGKLDGDGVALFDEKKPDQAIGRIAAETVTLDDPDGSGKIELKKTKREGPTLGTPAPAGAVILFNGKGTDQLVDAKVNEYGVLWSGFTTKGKFNDYTLHVEFMSPYMPYSLGQARGNSGVYMHDCYELQVLDSFGLEGADNECGGFYKLKVPDVNMCLPPLTWQTYDIDFTAPRYNSQGKRTARARVTVRHNGVTIHDNIELEATPGRQKEGPGPRPIHFQAHGNKVQYRDLWLVEKK